MALGTLYSYTQSQFSLILKEFIQFFGVDQNQFLFVQLISCIIQFYYHGQTDPMFIKQTFAACFVHPDWQEVAYVIRYIFLTAYWLSQINENLFNVNIMESALLTTRCC